MSIEGPASQPKELILVLSGPSGTGKSTVAAGLLARTSGLSRCVTVTTRPPRAAEIDGIDYHFVGNKRFEEMTRGDEFLEESSIYGHRYGTPRASVESILTSGNEVLLILDACGFEQVSRGYGADVLSVFLLPPSLEDLERRLRERGQDDEEVIQRRLLEAQKEIESAAGYDHTLVNSIAEEIIQSLYALLSARKARRAAKESRPLPTQRKDTNPS